MTQTTRANAALREMPAPIDPATVVGWGVDANPENDPTWPMRDRAGEDGAGADWDRPEVQHAGVEILQSVEHIRRPAAVGTSTPHSAVSGTLRRAAFRLSESQWGHWLILMLADRINSVEGLLDDLRRGIVPNPLIETGVVPYRHRRAAAAAVVTAGVVSGALALIVLRRRRP